MLQREKSKQCNHSPAGFGQNGDGKAVVGEKKLFLKENAFFWLFHFFITYGERRGKGKSKMEFYRKKGGEERETVYVLLGQILKGMNICFLLRMERLQWPTEGYMKYNQSILMKKIKDHELVGIV